ncbi:hypothetical protein ALC60_07798 [Trachymyrmex zeteki]|uniref:Uncharacterized protein n=1 Tax=Mycetomoellerius zeteki TaxID=64791 RepID=A0A151WYU8_9HYME|nr:hypothetical protein ALC60_07798 [Trachymyrmex zeteki]
MRLSISLSLPPSSISVLFKTRETRQRRKDRGCRVQGSAGAKIEVSSSKAGKDLLSLLPLLSDSSQVSQDASAKLQTSVKRRRRCCYSARLCSAWWTAPPSSATNQLLVPFVFCSCHCPSDLVKNLRCPPSTGYDAPPSSFLFRYFQLQNDFLFETADIRSASFHPAFSFIFFYKIR